LRKVLVIAAYLVCMLSSTAVAQTADSSLVAKPVQTAYEVRGIIRDKLNGQGIPFASAFFPSTSVGAVADLDGIFTLNYDVHPGDTLRINAIGYKDKNVLVSPNNKQLRMVVELEPDGNIMNEVVVRATYEDPALELLKKVIARKDINNPDKFYNYSCEAYNKIEIDLLRLTKRDFERLPIPYLKHFGYIYENMDSTSEAEPFLPIYLIETLSDYYYQQKPRKKKEYVKANQTRGVNNPSLMKYLGKMELEVNPYENYIPFFDKQFVSPIANQGATFYRYKIVDTSYEYGRRIFTMLYAPLRRGEMCFSGEIKIVDSSYALAYIGAVLPNESNVNWVKNASFYQEFAPLGDSLWFYAKENTTAELDPGSLPFKIPALVMKRTLSYKDIKANDSSVTRIINSARFKDQIVVADTADKEDYEFWSLNRHEELNKNEASVYQMFDTLEHDPAYYRFKKLVKFFASGVAKVGPFEFGPYWSTYSYNQIEGNRFRFSMGTTPKLFKDIYLNGYIAYGTIDKRVKYNMNGLWLLDRNPRMYLYASYTHDIDRGLNYYDNVGFDNFLSIAVRKPGIPRKFLFTDQGRFEFFRATRSGFSPMVAMVYKRFHTYDPLPKTELFTYAQGINTDGIISSEVNLSLRYAYQERFLEGNYYRTSLGSKYPTAEVRLALGMKGILNSGYEYKKVSFTISDNVKIAPLGSLYVNVFGGKYYGTLPFPLLEIHPGNETYVYNKYAFSMMNQFEFLSDEYIGINLEHSIGGGIFKYIPLIKKLHLRQFWTAKAITGGLNADNAAFNFNKGYTFSTLHNNPYVELGTGIENILRLFRVDLVWRVKPDRLAGEPQSKYFAIMGSIKIDF